MSSLASALIAYARTGGKNFTPVAKALMRGPSERSSQSPGMREPPESDGHAAAAMPSQLANGLLTLPTQWKGTHDTSGAGWNQDARSATDLMAAAGTWVGAPEGGVVSRYGSAQGGEALYFKGDSGATYWIGHIDSRVPIGTRVKKRGGRIARVSADHPAPHVHLDRITNW